MNHIFDDIDKSSRSQNSKEVIKRNVVHRLFGVDISPKLVKIAKANMLLGKDGHGGIEHANSLDSISKLSAKFNELCGIGKPSIILTNPPFGSGHDIRIKEPYILSQYKSGYQWELNEDKKIVYSDKLNEKQGTAPELLFLEKCLEWVKDDGIIGIVMAKGPLDNREAFSIRKNVWRSLIYTKIRLSLFADQKHQLYFFRRKRTVSRIIAYLWPFPIKWGKQVEVKLF